MVQMVKCVEVTEENGPNRIQNPGQRQGIPGIRWTAFETGLFRQTEHGFGLNFVKKVVDGHGGRIHVASRVGVGTTVTISVPEVKVADEEGLGG